MEASLNQQEQLTQVIESLSAKHSILTAACKADLLQVAKLSFAKSKTIIVEEHQLADTLYYISTGCFRAYYLKDDKDITDWFAFEEEFISSLNSYFKNIPSPHFIEALEPTAYLELKRADVIALTEKHRCFETLALKSAQHFMLVLQNRIVALQFETAQVKYDTLVKSRPDILNRVPLTHIASYLGVTLETLSRIRNPRNRI